MTVFSSIEIRHDDNTSENASSQAKQHDERTVVGATPEGDLPQLDTTSFQRSEGGSERGHTTAQSPSPMPTPAPHAVAGSMSPLASSPRLVAYEPTDCGCSQEYRDNSSNKEELHSSFSVENARARRVRLERPPLGSLMPPPPSPGRLDSCGVDLQEQQQLMCTETQSSELYQVRCENEKLRQELATRSADLQQALRLLELRELECIELNQLVDNMQTEVREMRESEKENIHTLSKENSATEAPHNVNSVAAAQRMSLSTKTGTVVNKSSRTALLPPDEETFKAPTLVAAVVDEDESLQQLYDERNRLAKELAETKVVVAEQASVLDRLGLLSPYPSEMVSAARRLIPRFLPLPNHPHHHHQQQQQ